ADRTAPATARRSAPAGKARERSPKRDARRTRGNPRGRARGGRWRAWCGLKRPAQAWTERSSGQRSDGVEATTEQHERDQRENDIGCAAAQSQPFVGDRAKTERRMDGDG